MKGILINNGKALGDGSGKVFTVQSEKGNPVTVYTEGEMDSLIIAENVDKIFKYIGDDGEYTKDHVYQVVDENGTLTIKDLSVGVALSPVTNVQLNSNGVLIWEAPDTTAIDNKLVSISYVIDVNGKEFNSDTTLLNVFEYIHVGENEVSVKAVISLYGKNSQNVLTFETPSEPVVIKISTKFSNEMGPASCASVGSNTYFFGNYRYDTPRNEILKFDAVSETITTLSLKLPVAMYNSVALPVGTDIYIFSGTLADNSISEDILKFDTTTETFTTLDTKLTTMRSYRYCGVFEKNIYFILGVIQGGYANEIESYSQEILKFDTTTETFTTLDTIFPYYMYESSSVYSGRNIYIMGGNFLLGSGAQSRSASIIKFDITTGEVKELQARLKEAVDYPVLIPFNENIYIFGGAYNSNKRTAIQKFDTITETIMTLNNTLPEGVYKSHTSVIDDRAYIFGGRYSTSILKVMYLQ